MSPRREPLLWLQCLALGAIPLELLLIRLLLAGSDPGPVPGVERLLLWGVGVVAPSVALWKRPVDWGSLLVVRRPTTGRNPDQQQLSTAQSSTLSAGAVVTAAVVLLPLLWWLDNSAVLVGEFSPVSGQSRLVTLLLSTPILAVIVWHVQQLIQASVWLITDQAKAGGESTTFSASQLSQERSSFGLQVLDLPQLTWPVAPLSSGTADASVGAAVAVKPDQAGEEEESATLNPEVAEVDAVPSGEAEGHGEEPETSGGPEGEPESPAESPPGGA